jgi:hypothetical protein
MESLLIIIPIVITFGNCVSSCYYVYITNRRLAFIENFIQSLNYSRQPSHYHPIPPVPSAPSETYTQTPPGYGYQQQNLNVI